jgi:hypothetical protein
MPILENSYYLQINNRNRVRRGVLCLSQDGACANLFENDRSDFHNFTIKSLWYASRRQVIMRAQSAVPSKHIEHTRQELMRNLSIRISF